MWRERRSAEKNMVSLELYSGAEKVGNSLFLLRDGKHALAFDYGMDMETENNFGLKRPWPDAVVVSHAHTDHCGGLFFQYMKSIVSSDVDTIPRIYGTEKTRKAVMVQLDDIGKVAIAKGQNISRHGKVLFDEYDVEKLKAAVSGKWHDTDKEKWEYGNFSIRQVKAGHIVGAAMSEVKHKDKNSDRELTVVYTGDISLEKNVAGDGPEIGLLEKEPDWLVMESTYGAVSSRQSKEKREAEFAEKIKEYVRAGKTIILPTFALERSQKVAHLVNEALRDVPKDDYNFYYLSPLGEKFSHAVYKDLSLRPFDGKKSRGIFAGGGRRLKKPAIVIASSGFGKGGYSESLLEEAVGDPNAVIFTTTSFVAPGTPIAEMLERGTLTIRGGRRRKVLARTDTVSLSSHASPDELVEIVRRISPKRKTKIVLVHGDPGARRALAEKLKGYDVILPKDGEKLEF